MRPFFLMKKTALAYQSGFNFKILGVMPISFYFANPDNYSKNGEALRDSCQ
ncbi:hypothetical protein NC99_32410 [Sunxiuqinia dokdonensis]|uniref:Uncharacterized protein n=1 Tax=Sunxiuqinia dokdonensis TaxID=1409788 RepID=A0A0L8V628_9BACT|nr:hypothetical protein NC99_32410 [Sunxiuqinia dokdonensis]